MDNGSGLNSIAMLPLPAAILQGHDLLIETGNKAFENLCAKMGISPNKLSDFFSGLSDDELLAIRRIYKSGQDFQVEEISVKDKTGKHNRYMSAVFSHLKNDPSKICLVAYDVTRYVNKPPGLGESENRFETLINQTPMATALYVGEDMVIQIANPAMLKLWGKDETVIGKKIRYALPELQGQPFHELLKNVRESGTAYHSEEDQANLMINGVLETKYFNFTYQPIFDAEGKVYAILNMAINVTSQVEAKKQLQNEQETTRLALTAAGLGTWVLYPVNNNIEWDERCKELYGFLKEDIIAYEDVLKHTHPHDRCKVHAAVQQALEPKSEGKYFCEFRTIGASDKRLRWLRCKGKAYFGDDGLPYRFAGTAQNISAEMEQKCEQDKLLSLMENNSDFVAISNQKGEITYINGAGRKLMGIDADADTAILNARDFYYNKSDYLANEEILTENLQKGTWQETVNLRNLKTGELIVGLVNCILLKDPNGEISGRGATIRDLRPALTAKKALEDSELLLRSITSEAPITLWMSDATGRVTYINQTWIEWTGIPFEAQLGYGWTKAVIEEDRDMALNKFIAAVKAREPYDVEFRIRHKDGSVHWTVAKGNMQFNPEGVFIGYIGSNTDITENIVAEKKLQATNDQLNHHIKQFEFVTDVMPQMVWVTRADGYNEYFNQRWYDFTGLTFEQTKDTGWANILHPDDYDRAWSVWKHCLHTGDPYEIEYRMLRFDGEYRWLLARALPLLGDNYEVVKWFGTCTDIHEQKLLERQKDDFLGIASHELKTPVTSIKAYAQVLESVLRKKGDEKEAFMASKMNAQINRLTILIGDLLDVTKINSGRMQFNKSLFLFNEMVAEMIEELQRTSQNHTIIENFESSGLVFGDRERIGQVITNMITNAIKYSPNADKIIVHTSIEEHEVILCVEDFGVGIPKDKQAKVFEQFYRVSGDMQHTFPGLGLGLYISSEIIKREGGRIWVVSNEGQGSTFCFSLPLNTTDL